MPAAFLAWIYLLPLGCDAIEILLAVYERDMENSSSHPVPHQSP